MPSSTSNSEPLYPAVGLSVARRRSARAILLILLAWFLGDRLLGMACDKAVLASQLRFSKIYNRTANADLLFFGDSRAVNTFHAPSIDALCGTRSLNLGYNGCSASLASLLFEDYLERNPSPHTVVLEVTCARQGDELLKNLKMYEASSSRIAAALRSESPCIATACAVSALYAFNSEMFLRSLYYLRSDDRSWVNRYSINEALLQKAAQDAASPLPLEPPTPANLAAIARMGAICRERGIRFVGVVGPYLPDHAARLVNLSDWQERVHKATGLQIVDLSSALPYSTHFADTLHVNAAGAEALVPVIRNAVLAGE